ncbi:uncharacterized protein LOC120447627 isoform X1 [Drosophila santomea]|uniref:uncharacterized protein LOC120447627 isoform X1 n=1 Tax=Drosophila santomea TaxID=129105 RepID=UPI00195329B4|nr:uncharacterized protein LOC120447627 isoform X1 [Drosophila santomea]
MEITVPPPDSHWSLRFVDIVKPFPDQTVANATYKVIRFFYPPFALETVDVTHVVSDPELNSLNVGLFVGFPLFLACIGYGMFKYARNVHSVPKERPFKLYELEKRMKAKYGPEYKQGIWKRKDIPDPLLLTNDPSEPVEKSKHDRGSSMSNNFFIEDHWLPESVENFIKTDGSVDKIRGKTENGESRMFDCSTQLGRHSDLAGEIKNALKERKRKAEK